jgi:hypothetical protein
MATKAPNKTTDEGFSVFDLWAKYEDITTHFNDLLMKLRTQALAGVATLSTAVGIFAKSESQSANVWQLAGFTIIGLCLVWIAIWVLDAFYYNRLLAGAVHALKQIENESKSNRHVPEIGFSTAIEDVVLRKICSKQEGGVRAFYLIILIALVGGAGVCFYEHHKWEPVKKSDRQPMVTRSAPAPVAPTPK